MTSSISKSKIGTSAIRSMQNVSQHNPIINLDSEIQKFIKFVSMFPDVDDAILMIYPGEYCQPSQFQKIYPKSEKFASEFNIYVSSVNIDNQSKVMVGLGRQYFNLIDKQVDKVSFRHLVLLYLIKKIKFIKFVLCFDKKSIYEHSFSQVRKTFSYLCSIFNLDSLYKLESSKSTSTNFFNSFMILISHNGQQKIIQKCQLELKNSLNEENFWQQQQKTFVQSIINGILESKRIIDIDAKQINKPSESSEKGISINSQEQLKAYDQIKQKFEGVIEKIMHFQTKSKTRKLSLQINETFLISLQTKSTKCIIYKRKRKLQLKKNEMVDPQKEKINYIFYIWDQIFSVLIDHVIRKIKKGFNQVTSFKDIEKQSAALSSNKYQIKISNKPNFKKSQEVCSSFGAAVLFNNFLQFFIKTKEQSDRLEKGKNEELQQNFFKENLNEFLLLLFENNVLDAQKQQKVFYNYFAIFHEIHEAWNDIKGVLFQNTVSSETKQQSRFFSDSNLTTTSLSNWKIFINDLTQNLQKMFMFQVQVDIQKCRTGKYVKLQLIEDKIKAIKTKLSETKDERIKQKLHVQRLTALINLYYAELHQIKLKKLSSKPIEKLNYLLVHAESLFQIGTQLPVSIGQTLFQCLTEMKNKNFSFKLKKILIQFLEFGSFQQNSKAMEFLKKQFQFILGNKVSKQQSISQENVWVINSYIQILIKMGYVQKARQNAYKVSSLDQNLAKALLCKSLMREVAKKQFQFIRKDDPNKPPVEFSDIKPLLEDLKQQLHENRIISIYGHNQDEELLDI